MSEDWLDSITLHQLRLFAAVARDQSFSRAAEALYLGEATVSEQIKVLETLVGVRLLDRSPGRRIVKLTESGRILHSGYARASDELEKAVGEIAALRGAGRGSVGFGAGVHFGSSHLPLVCDAFQRAHPAIALRVEVDQRQHLLASLRQRRLDLLVLAGTADDPDLTIEPLADYEVFLVGPYGHRLAQVQQPAPFSELASEPLILPRARCAGVRREMERLAVEAGIVLKVVLELRDVEAQLQAVSGGIGITALPAASLKARIAAEQLSVLQVRGFPMRQHWCVVHAGGQLTDAAQTLRDFLFDYVATMMPDSLPATSALTGSLHPMSVSATSRQRRCFGHSSPSADRGRVAFG